MPTKIEITTKSVLLIVLIFVVGWLLVQVRDILVLLFVSFIVMSALKPLVDRVDQLRLPRFLAILAVYAIVISVIVGFGTAIVPPLVSQTVRLTTNLPRYFTQAAPFININQDTIISQIAPIGQNVARVTIGIFSNIVTFFTIAVFAFYFLLEHRNLRHFLDAFVGDELGDRIVIVVKTAEAQLGAWIRGELLLALIIGLASYLGLTLLGISYALPLALIAGVLEVIPIIGPIISAIPAVLVALTVSPGLALAVVALYFIIQQLENNLIVPGVMQKAVGVPPLASLLALMIGGRLGGIVGIILAVPILLVVKTIIQEFVSTTPKSTAK